MEKIHYRKTMTGEQTWCGVWRMVPELGGMDNTSPLIKEVTCKKCLNNAAKWREQYNKRKAREEAERERPKMSYLSEKIFEERKEAEAKAIDSLARYKFQMFGYWSAIWVHLNKISDDPQPNPFLRLVKVAREMKEGIA